MAFLSRIGTVEFQGKSWLIESWTQEVDALHLVPTGPHRLELRDAEGNTETLEIHQAWPFRGNSFEWPAEIRR